MVVHQHNADFSRFHLPCTWFFSPPHRQELRLRTATKAMRLLGLTELPPEARHIEHPTSLPRNNSFMLTSRSALPGVPGSITKGSTRRTPSASPPSRRLSNSLLGSENNESLPGRGVSSPGRTVKVPESNKGVLCSIDSEGIELYQNDAGGGEHVLSNCTGVVSRGERTTVTETPTCPLKLAATDIDDHFLKMIMKLMAQFPTPPTSSCVSGESAEGRGASAGGMRVSPKGSVPAGGRGRGGIGIRSSRSSRASFGPWKGPERQLHQQVLEQVRRLGDSQQQKREDARRVYELDDPVKRSYAKGDLFQL